MAVPHATQYISRANSRTFDRVEFARRRIVELLATEDLAADRDAIARRIDRTAAHCWCFWIAPQPTRAALLVSGDWNLSGLLLLGMFARVEIWEIDAQRAAVLKRVAEEIDAELSVCHVSPAQFAERLERVEEPFGLVAMQDALELLAPRPRRARRSWFEQLRAATSADGQSCIVGRNRFALSERSRWFDTGRLLPTPAELSRSPIARGHGAVERIFFHPSHSDPSEILFPPSLLPRARRKQPIMRLLQRTGVVERILGSFASFHPPKRGQALVDRAVQHWFGLDARAEVACWRSCDVRENAMMLVTVGLSDGAEVIVRIPLLSEAVEALRRVDSVYAELASTLPHLVRLMPEARPLLSACGWPMHIERKCPGVPASALVRDLKSRAAVRVQLAEMVNGMCAATVRTHSMDEPFVAAHYGSKLKAIRAVETELAQDLSQIELAVTELVRGRTMATVRIHGDLTVNNAFFDSVTGKLSCVIDWEASLAQSMPFDLVHYLIAEQRELDPQPWGVLVARALAGELFDAEAQALLIAHVEKLGLTQGHLTLLLIGYWLRGLALRQTLSGGRLAADWRNKNLVGPIDSIRRTLNVHKSR